MTTRAEVLLEQLTDALGPIPADGAKRQAWFLRLVADAYAAGFLAGRTASLAVLPGSVADPNKAS